MTSSSCWPVGYKRVVAATRFAVSSSLGSSSFFFLLPFYLSLCGAVVIIYGLISPLKRQHTKRKKEGRIKRWGQSYKMRSEWLDAWFGWLAVASVSGRTWLAKAKRLRAQKIQGRAADRMSYDSTKEASQKNNGGDNWQQKIHWKARLLYLFTLVASIRNNQIP